MYVEGKNSAQKGIRVDANTICVKMQRKGGQREETRKGRKLNLVFCLYCSTLTKERKKTLLNRQHKNKSKRLGNRSTALREIHQN